MTINRGGARISIVKATAHHIPTITIGHLDDKGKDLLDNMLKGSSTVDEIVEYFKNYVNEDRPKFDAKAYRSSRSRQTSVEPAAEAEKADLRNLNDQLKRVDKRAKSTEPANKFSNQTKFGNVLNVPTNLAKNNTMKQNNEGMDEHDNILDDIIIINDNDKKDEQDMNEIDLMSRNRKNGSTNVPPTLNNSKNVKSIEDSKSSEIKPVTVIEKDQIKKKKEPKKIRNVFDILDADYIKRTIPYMHPSSKKHTFRFFEDRVHDVVDGKGLLENDVLDVMEFRMGGSYLAEMKQLRGQKWDLDYIENYYLQKDIDMENERKKKKELIEKSAKVKNTLHLNSITNFSTPG